MKKFSILSKKRIVYAVFVFMTCLTSYAQKLNNRGQKMVSSVEVTKYDINKRIGEHSFVSYGYNHNGELTKIIRELSYDGDTHKEILTKEGNELRSKVYVNGRQTKDYFHLYDMNENGLIKRKITQYAIDNDSVRKITDYHYDDEMRLVQVERWQQVKDSKKWWTGNDESYYNFKYVDGNCYWSKMWSSTFNITGKIQYYGGGDKHDNCRYGDILNDTNINLNLFVYLGMCWSICLDVHDFELSSEWCSMQTTNILEYSGEYNVIANKDSNGNVTELVTRRKHVRYVVKVNYLY